MEGEVVGGFSDEDMVKEERWFGFERIRTSLEILCESHCLRLIWGKGKGEDFYTVARPGALAAKYLVPLEIHRWET